VNDLSAHTAPAKRTTRASLGWRTATIAGVVLAIALCLFLIIYAASGFLLLFAGILFAVFLDALTRALSHVLPIARGLRLTIVCIVTSLAAIGFVTSVGVTETKAAPWSSGAGGQK